MQDREELQNSTFDLSIDSTPATDDRLNRFRRLHHPCPQLLTPLRSIQPSHACMHDLLGFSEERSYQNLRVMFTINHLQSSVLR